MSKRKGEEKERAQVGLLLIDVQEAFWTGVPAIREAFPNFKENVIKLLAWARRSGLHIVHIRAEYNRELSPWLTPFLELNPDKKVNENVKTESVESWAREQPGEKIVSKHTFDGFLNTDLEEHLKKLNITHLFVGGLITTACVLSTCLGGFFRGFTFALVEDCCGDRTQEKHLSCLAIYGNYIYARISLKDVDSILEKWKSTKSKEQKTEPPSVLNTKVIKESGIIPDVIDDFTPTIGLTVNYGTHSVTLGNSLKPSDAKSAPIVKWTADDSLFYTLVMIDPDAPSCEKPKFRNWRHWIVINVVGGTISSSQPGEELCSYAGPTPPGGSGDHRYVFLLYSHKQKITASTSNSAKSFDVRAFTKTYGLGAPVGINWFLAKT